MKSYWNQPEATAQALRNGWMHTGDLGYMDEDGFVFVVDRLKDMIITGGENVYSSEIENVICQHLAVSKQPLPLSSAGKILKTELRRPLLGREDTAGELEQARSHPRADRNGAATGHRRETRGDGSPGASARTGIDRACGEAPGLPTRAE